METKVKQLASPQQLLWQFQQQQDELTQELHEIAQIEKADNTDEDVFEAVKEHRL